MSSIMPCRVLKRTNLLDTCMVFFQHSKQSTGLAVGIGIGIGIVVDADVGGGLPNSA